MPASRTADRALGALLGLAIGDAVGTTLEFSVRDSRPPLTDMVGGGPFDLAPGEWTDDTAMALALADSLLACDGPDPGDLMRRFVRWWRHGDYSPTGHCFDIGNATAAALGRFERTGDAMAGSVDPSSAGNGSLMRLAPIAIWGVGAGEEAMRAAARLQSATTHAAATCLDACEAFAVILRAAMLGADLDAAAAAADGIGGTETRAVIDGNWRDKPRSDVPSSGYVLHTLEAALWCVASAPTPREVILLAANLGDDADTTAAVAGQLAGALHGAAALPEAWRGRLAWGERIASAALGLLG